MLRGFRFSPYTPYAPRRRQQNNTQQISPALVGGASRCVSVAMTNHERRQCAHRETQRQRTSAPRSPCPLWPRHRHWITSKLLFRCAAFSLHVTTDTKPRHTPPTAEMTEEGRKPPPTRPDQPGKEHAPPHPRGAPRP